VIRAALAVCAALIAQPLAAAAPNLVLLSVDTLRADRLGCYGHDKPTSPHLDAFAATALRFDDAVCEVPLTAPSFGAMLTSRYPRTINMPRNGLPLPGDVPTVPLLLQQAGYHTFCVQSNWTLKKHLSALDRGFDVYDDDFHEGRWGALKSERDGADVTARALALLAGRPADKPFFAWIHFSDPHAPYKLHEGLTPSGKPRRFTRRDTRIRMQYDSEVAYVDQQIGKVLAALPPETVVVFVGDHGESLYEHDYLGHGRRLYHNTLRIPLLVRAPGVAPGACAAPVRGMDVGPTLLGLAGVPVAEGMRGLDLVKTAPPMDRVRVVETYRGAVPNLPRGLRAWMEQRGPLKQAVIQEGWKLIVDGKRSELYHLVDDPGELKNLHLREARRVAEMQTILSAWDGSIQRVEESGDLLTPQDLEALESLGYLD
jgi:arylsulfatase A-like enzyme